MAGRSRDISNEQVLIEFYLHDDPVMVAKEVADILDMTRQGVHNRLKQLEAKGFLHSKKPGRDRIYWLTKDGRTMARQSLRE